MNLGLLFGIKENTFLGVIHFYLKKVGVKVDKQELKAKLNDHPFYPTFNALTDTLQEYGVDSSVVKLSPEEISFDLFKEIPVPFFVT